MWSKHSPDPVSHFLLIKRNLTFMTANPNHPCVIHKQFPFPSLLVKVSNCRSAQGIFSSKESHPKALRLWRNSSSAPFIVGGERLPSVGVFFSADGDGTYSEARVLLWPQLCPYVASLKGSFKRAMTRLWVLLLGVFLVLGFCLSFCLLVF